MAPKKRPGPVNVDAASLPRVTCELTNQQLKEECAARDESRGTSNLSKERLLAKLTEGSICLSLCPEYRYVQAVRTLMAEEKRQPQHAKVKCYDVAHTCSGAAGKENSFQTEQHANMASARPQDVRAATMQAAKPLVSRDWQIEGYGAEPLAAEVCCGMPYGFDFYGSVFDFAGGDAERDPEPESLEKELAAYDQMYREVPSKNKKPLGQGFTVYSSAGYPPSSFHSYDGPPEKVFDSSWDSAVHANQRARYLFYADAKKTYGVGPDELFGGISGAHVEEEKLGSAGLLKLSTHPDDSEIWTVAVVPDMVFEHLGNTAYPPQERPAQINMMDPWYGSFPADFAPMAFV